MLPCVSMWVSRTSSLCLLCWALCAHKAPPDHPPPSRHQPSFPFGAVSHSASLCVVFGSGQFSATICLLLIALSVFPNSLSLSLSLFLSLFQSFSLPSSSLYLSRHPCQYQQIWVFFPFCICASHSFQKSWKTSQKSPALFSLIGVLRLLPLFPFSFRSTQANVGF